MKQSTTLSADQASVLQSLGYLYLQHGQLGRGLALVILADRCRPGVPTIMRTLIYAFLKNSEPLKALQVIERIEQAEGVIDPASPLQLLRAQALWLCGEKDLGRRVFARFNRARQSNQQFEKRERGMPPALVHLDEYEDDLVLGRGDRA